MLSPYKFREWGVYYDLHVRSDLKNKKNFSKKFYYLWQMEKERRFVLYTGINGAKSYLHALLKEFNPDITTEETEEILLTSEDLTLFGIKKHKK